MAFIPAAADSPDFEQPVRQGVLPVDTLPLYRRLAPLVVKQRMADLGISPGSAAVAAVGDNLTAELGKILTELALQVRYLTVSMKYGAEEFCHSLRREYEAVARGRFREEAGTVVFSWEGIELEAYGRYRDDRLYGAVACPDLRDCYVEELGRRGEGGEHAVRLVGRKKGMAVWAYVFATDAEGKTASGSACVLDGTMKDEQLKGKD